MAPVKRGECRSSCPIANILDVVGDRWTLLVIRDMMFAGRHEFHEFANAEEGIATNILVDRLKRLLDDEIIKSVPHPTNKKRKYYYLTRKGKALMPLMTEMAIWAHTYLPEVKIPKDIVRKVTKSPRTFMDEMLARLDAWEKEQGVR